MRLARASAFFAALAATLAVGAPAFAQTVPDSQAIATLDRALAQVNWEPERRGALLVVAPQQTRHPAYGTSSVNEQGNRFWTVSQDFTPPPPLPPPPRSGYLLRTVADYFGRKVVRLDSLTVLAPATMVVLNPHPGKPNLLRPASEKEALTILEGTLSAAQWRLLGSPQGLGFADLSAEQRELFDSVLPDPFVLSVRRLTPAERLKIRLRLKRSTVLRRVDVDPGRPTFAAASFDFPVTGPYLSSEGHVTPQGNYGTALLQTVPSRLKPSQLNFDAPVLAAAISLANVGTIGELIQRVAEATRLELYADSRVAKLPVWAAGESARAGDLLKAVCYAVTGTFRRVGDETNAAFLLTDDVEGIGARRVRLEEWLSDAQALVAEQMQRNAEQISRLKPIQYIGFGSNDPLASRPELLRRLEASWSEKSPLSGFNVALNDLPSELQARLRAQMQGEEGIRPGQINVSAVLTKAYLVPGVGEVDYQGWSSDDLYALIGRPSQASSARPVPKTAISLPPLPVRVLCVAPQNGEEATGAVRAALPHGFTHLWVVLTPGDDARPLLESAIAAGRENGVPVLARVRLLQTAPPPAQADRNVLGETTREYLARRAPALPPRQSVWGPKPTGEETFERYRSTGDWQRTDTPGAVQQLAQRLKPIVATPDLAGMVVTDTAAPGYGNAMMVGPFPGVAAALGGWLMGYTPAMRLAFLRAEGCDPLDLAPVSNPPGPTPVNLSLPFFPDFPAWRGSFRQSDDRILDESGTPTLEQKWRAFRQESNLRFLKEFFTALRAARPDLPLWIHDRFEAPAPPSWFVPWEAPDGVPRRVGNRVPLRTKAFSPRALLNVAPLPNNNEYLATRFRAASDGYGGIVLDLSEMPVPQALSWLGTRIASPRQALDQGATTRE